MNLIKLIFKTSQGLDLACNLYLCVIYKKDLVTKIRKFEYKERPISYASHYDSLIYSWYAYQLEDLYEKRIKSAGLTDSIIAYRRLGKSNVYFALETFKFIKKK